MIKEFCYQKQKRKFKSILLILLFLLNLGIMFLVKNHFYPYKYRVLMNSYEKFITTFFLLSSLIIIYVLLRNEYKKTKKFSITYIIGLNVISMINFIGSFHVEFNICSLLFRSIAFLSVITLGLFILWIAKTEPFEKFTIFLIISVLTVILNFGGLYGSFYSMYEPYGQECFKIDQGMDYSQSIMATDLIYYSSDTFFGTSISDIHIHYIDYTKWYEEGSMESIHIGKYEQAYIIIQLVKILSLLESVTFLVYISLIVMNANSNSKENSLKSC